MTIATQERPATTDVVAVAPHHPARHEHRRVSPMLVGGAVCGLAAVALVVAGDGFDGTQNVPGTANILGAGMADAPAFTGGGAAASPVLWRLPDGPDRIATFPSVTGHVRPDRGYVVGVFLPDDPVRVTSAARLDATDPGVAGPLEPDIGQTFRVDDGGGSRVAIPDDATRLYLGFTDGLYPPGDPGGYENNRGHLSVTVDVETE